MMNASNTTDFELLVQVSTLKLENDRPGNTVQCIRSYDPLSICRIVLFLIGCTGNAVVVLCIATRHTFRKNATYVVIGCLAVADFLYLFAPLLNTVVIQGYKNATNFRQAPDQTCVPSTLYYFLNDFVLSVVMNAAFLASTFHIPYISAVRYLILVHPFKALKILNAKRVLTISAAIWFAAIAVRVTDFVTVHLLDDRFPLEVVLWCLDYFVPLCLTAVFHVLKIRELRHSLKSCASPTIKRISRTVTIVILIFAITLMPWNLCRLLYFVLPPGSITLEIWLSTGFIFYLNSVLNPFVYAFMSDVFRKQLSLFFISTKVCRRCQTQLKVTRRQPE